MKDISDNDLLILLIVGAMMLPTALVGMWHVAKAQMITIAQQSGFLTTPYLVAVPGTGRGIDAPHLLLLVGAMGMTGLLATLLGKALRPKAKTN